MNGTQRSTDELITDPSYPALKGHLIQATGLTYYTNKDDDLTRRIQRRLSSLGLADCASYLELLKEPVRGRSELDELIAEITIGETYFFRHQEHFDALRDTVLPDLLARNQGKRSLRIWCAGCANGPEPYSIAILLGREMSHQLLDWNVSILGTDINRSALARAREGLFEEWALRATNEDLRRECFVKEGRYWRIAEPYRQWLSFQYHNLVEDPFPSLINNLGAFDLIVCRNVMIYFGSDLMTKVIQQFYKCLVEDGWLLVGPAEPNMTAFTSFGTVNFPGVTVFRKGPAGVPAAAVIDPFNPPLLPPRPTASGASARRPVTPLIQRAEPGLADVRLHADRGEWANAVECCERLLKKDSLNSLVHFYHGLILEQMAHHSAAEVALRRAIYLDRRSVLPHYYLGLLLQSQGDPQRAARSFQNALHLLQKYDNAEAFREFDGITAAEMKKLAQMQLEVLQG